MSSNLRYPALWLAILLAFGPSQALAFGAAPKEAPAQASAGKPDGSDT